jgi:hypothetical protein
MPCLDDHPYGDCFEEILSVQFMFSLAFTVEINKS